MRNAYRVIFTMWVACIVFLGPVFPAGASDALRYCASAQVYDVFQDQNLNRFSKETDIPVDLFVGSSAAAMQRLIGNMCDIVGLAEPITKNQEDYGYVQTPFCRVPLIVITNVKTTVRNITEDQLRNVFSGNITNWQELGGPDQTIVVVVPAPETAAFRNFTRLALDRSDVRYDFMAYRSTGVVSLVHRIPWSISFIGKGAVARDSAVKILSINGRSYDNIDYPYYETFVFVTKGVPEGNAKSLIKFAGSPGIIEDMRSAGLSPLIGK